MHLHPQKVASHYSTLMAQMGGMSWLLPGWLSPLPYGRLVEGEEGREEMREEESGSLSLPVSLYSVFFIYYGRTNGESFAEDLMMTPRYVRSSLSMAENRRKRVESERSSSDC